MALYGNALFPDILQGMQLFQVFFELSGIFFIDLDGL